MKISVTALYQIAGIHCVYDAGKGQADPARIAYVTGSSVSAVIELGKKDGKMKPSDGDPDVNFGSVVAITRSASGEMSSRVIKPGGDSGFRIDVDGTAMPMTGSGMLPLRTALREIKDAGRELSRDQKRTLDGLQEVFHMVASAPDTARFPDGLIAQSYHALMIDAFGDVELPVDGPSFGRKSRGDLFRARIGILDPRNPDALTSARTLKEFLSDAGIEISENGVATNISNPSMSQISEEAIRRSVLSNDRLCRDVFGAITATPVEKLSAALIPIEGLGNLRSSKKSNRLSGEWVDRVSARARSITGANGKGGRFEVSIFSDRGRDIMAIADEVGQRNGVAFLYSWPTADRVPVLKVDEGRVLNMSREEIPTEDEISRLKTTLRNIEAINIHDEDFDTSDKATLAQ